MPNTKSAERRARNSVRKQSRNRSARSRLKTLEAKFDSVVKSGKRDEAMTALRSMSSALDKAAKTGVIHSATASRKKSRLAARAGKVGKPA